MTTISDNPLCCPDNLKSEIYVVFGLQLQVLQWANLKTEDTFVILGPNGLGSFKTWLTEALFLGAFWHLKKVFWEFLTVLE